MNRLYIFFPHCYIKATLSELLIYDTILYKNIYLKNVRLTSRSINKLNRLGYIEENDETMQILQKIEDFHMGYYIQYNELMPYLPERKLRISTSLYKEKKALGHNLTSYSNMMLTSVTLLLSNTMSPCLNSISYRQLDYPNTNNAEIDIKKLYAHLSAFCLEKIILSGEMSYNQLESFVQWADDKNTQIIYRIHYLAYSVQYIQKILLAFNSLMIELIIDSNTPSDYLNIRNKRLIYKYMIVSMSDADKAQKLGEELMLIPIFTDTKTITLQPQMILDRNEILQSHQTLNECYLKEYINMYSFGHLTIDYNGEVYCLDKCIGSLRNNDLPNIINNWVVSPDCGWYLTRKDKECCKECALQVLCPPISLYEQLNIYKSPCMI